MRLSTSLVLSFLLSAITAAATTTYTATTFVTGEGKTGGVILSSTGDTLFMTNYNAHKITFALTASDGATLYDYMGGSPPGSTDGAISGTRRLKLPAGGCLRDSVGSYLVLGDKGTLLREIASSTITTLYDNGNTRFTAVVSKGDGTKAYLTADDNSVSDYDFAGDSLTPLSLSTTVNTPSGITFSSSGETILVVADTGNHKIVQITISTGTVASFIGDGTDDVLDGPDGSARVSNPTAIVADYTNSVFYWAETSQHVVRKSTGGTTTTIVGLAGTSGTTNDVGTAARLDQPSAIVLSSDGNTLFIGQQTTRVVRIAISTATSAPSTATPSTATPSTATPSTATPSTATPSTATPSTATPSTATPSTATPSTATPSTATPSTATPSTATPSTATPSTATPSTATPSTATPSTATPSTATPSTATPSTATPSTATPSTATPSTATPSTATPSTATPSTATPSTATPSTATPTTSTAPVGTCGCTTYVNGASVTDAVTCAKDLPTGVRCMPPNQGDGKCPGDHERCVPVIVQTDAPSATTESPPTTTQIPTTEAPVITTTTSAPPTTTEPATTTTTTNVPPTPSPTTTEAPKTPVTETPRTLEPPTPPGAPKRPVYVLSVTVAQHIDYLNNHRDDLKQRLATASNVDVAYVTILRLYPGSTVVEFEVETNQTDDEVASSMQSSMRVGGSLYGLQPVVDSFLMKKKAGAALFELGVAFYFVLAVCVCVVIGALGWTIYRAKHPAVPMKTVPKATMRDGRMEIGVTHDDDEEGDEAVRLFTVGPTRPAVSTDVVFQPTSGKFKFRAIDYSISNDRHAGLTIKYIKEEEKDDSGSGEKDSSTGSGGSALPLARAPPLIIDGRVPAPRVQRQDSGLVSITTPTQKTQLLPKSSSSDGLGLQLTPRKTLEEATRHMQPSREVIDGDIIASYRIK